MQTKNYNLEEENKIKDYFTKKGIPLRCVLSITAPDHIGKLYEVEYPFKFRIIQISKGKERKFELSGNQEDILDLETKSGLISK